MGGKSRLVKIRQSTIDTRGRTHIEPLLGAHLLDKQDLRNSELDANMRDDLAVDEVLLEPDVAPHGLHHAERHRVEVVPDSNSRKLVLYGAVVRLKPSDKRLIPLELRYHALAVGGRVIRPVNAALYDLVSGHVDDAHGFGGGLIAAKHGEMGIVFLCSI